MELVKELPEIFEEFAEQRQKSFLVMKEVKDKGIPVIGAYCTYFPQEIAMAMGAANSRTYVPHLMRQSRLQNKIIAKEPLPDGKSKLWFCCN